jgi:hypothetical protein
MTLYLKTAEIKRGNMGKTMRLLAGCRDVGGKNKEKRGKSYRPSS